MSIPCMRRGLVGLVLTASTVLVQPSIASATNLVCGERGSSNRLLDSREGSLVFAVDDHDLISWQALDGRDRIEININGSVLNTVAPGGYRVTSGVTSVVISLVDPTGRLAVSCVKDDTQDATETTAQGASGMSANSQTNATNTGVGLNTKARFGYGGNFVSSDSVFLSTANLSSSQFLPADWSAWVSFEGRGYSGGMSGFSMDLVGGVDRMITPDLVIGVLGGFGRTVVSNSGTPEVVSSPMLGFYFGNNAKSGLIIDGFISAAKPVYDVNGATFRASRQSLGLTLSGKIQKTSVALEPFLFARGYQEAQPAYTMGGGGVVGQNETTAFSASLGVKLSMQGAQSTKTAIPYISASADYRVISSTNGSKDRVLAPRIGFGFSGKLGAADVSLDVDIGKARSDTIDRGVKLGYQLKF